MSDGIDKDEDDGRPFTPSERRIVRKFIATFGDKQDELDDMLTNYERSQWLFELTLKVGKWAGAVTALVALAHLLWPQLRK